MIIKNIIKSKEVEKMSEEKKVFCTQCGNAAEAGTKFCSNCGAKMEETVVNEPVQPVYEKVEAEVVSEGASQPMQGEININYDSTASENKESAYATPEPQYYTNTQQEDKKTNGNIGFSIASLVCGILSLLCCCFTVLSLILGIAAIALGVVVICCKYDGKGMAIAGIVTGGIGLVIVVILFIIGSSTDVVSDLMDELSYYYY